MTRQTLCGAKRAKFRTPRSRRGGGQNQGSISGSEDGPSQSITDDVSRIVVLGLTNTNSLIGFHQSHLGSAPAAELYWFRPRNWPRNWRMHRFTKARANTWSSTLALTTPLLLTSADDNQPKAPSWPNVSNGGLLVGALSYRLLTRYVIRH